MKIHENHSSPGNSPKLHPRFFIAKTIDFEAISDVFCCRQGYPPLERPRILTLSCLKLRTPPALVLFLTLSSLKLRTLPFFVLFLTLSSLKLRTPPFFVLFLTLSSLKLQTTTLFSVLSSVRAYYHMPSHTIICHRTFEGGKSQEQDK